MKLKKKVMAVVLASAVSMSLIVPSFAIDLPMTYVENGYYTSDSEASDAFIQSLISGGKGIVSFSGTYKMLARVDYVFTGQNNVSAIITIPVGATLDFGTFTDSFAIYAEEEPEDRVP